MFYIDIPFQLVFQKHYGLPLFVKSLVLAHDVDDFSKIWQAMGRSRTMNDTIFSIYKSGITEEVRDAGTLSEIKAHGISRKLYTLNCDRKIAGNISSAYLTVIALYNLAKNSFYYTDKIVNTFLDKMEKTLANKVFGHSQELKRTILNSKFISSMLYNIIVSVCCCGLLFSDIVIFVLQSDKLKRSTRLSGRTLDVNNLETVLEHVVTQKYELRKPSNDFYDDLIAFLSGEQKNQMEISYTKQQQKQKQTQKNKNQDSDSMGVFDKKHQLVLAFEAADYFASTLDPTQDFAKVLLNLPCQVPIVSIQYSLSGNAQTINVYPTLQFLYSHFVQASYISEDVQAIFKEADSDTSKYYHAFVTAIRQAVTSNGSKSDSNDPLNVRVHCNYVRQNPQYTIAALERGVYLIGTKDQFNKFDIPTYPLKDRIQFITDEIGFTLFDTTNTRDIDDFGPYCIESYILMEVLSKQEIAQNVIEMYSSNKEKLRRCLSVYQENQGKGFICWRFLMNEAFSNSALSGLKRRRGDSGPIEDVTNGIAKCLDI